MFLLDIPHSSEQYNSEEVHEECHFIFVAYHMNVMGVTKLRDVREEKLPSS